MNKCGVREQSECEIKKGTRTVPFMINVDMLRVK